MSHWVTVIRHGIAIKEKLENIFKTNERLLYDIHNVAFLNQKWYYFIVL